MSLHLNANQGDFARTVIMPGDPQRAKWIAENFLENIKIVNTVRDNFGYTGTFLGKKVSVLASGMGQPTLGIYVNELFNSYGVESIIRVGTCGALWSKLKIGDCVVALSAGTDSNITFTDTMSYMAPCCSYNLLSKLKTSVARCFYGQVFSTDRFYKQSLNTPAGPIAIDMETHYLYYLANKFERHALTLNVVSDIVSTGETMSYDEKIIRTKSIVSDVLENLI